MSDTNQHHRPLTDVFAPRIRGIGHLLRKYPQIGGWQGFNAGDTLFIELSEGEHPTIRAWRPRTHHHTRHQAMMELGNITPAGTTDLEYGPETLLKSEVISSREADYDNRHNENEVEVTYGDLFGKGQSHEHTDEQSAGSSLSISVEASEGVEGVAEFSESVTAEVHAEVSSSSTDTTEASSEASAEESTTIPAGKHMRITETISRADTVQTVKAKGRFTHNLSIGEYIHHDGSESHKRRYMTFWDSWSQFVDCCRGDAPDNWPLAQVMKHNPPWHGDMWALADNLLSADLEYRVKFEGKVIRSYHVEEF